MTNIAILGGGIGGLSAAIALKQEGFTAEVYERHSELNQIGAGIVCWPNACFVLDKLQVLAQVAEVAGNIQQMNRYSQTGETLGSLDIEHLNQWMMYPSYSIIRKDLMRILQARCQQLNIPIHYDHTIVELSGDHKVSVTFANNKKITPELIIGAEGRMNSPSRTFVNGKNKPIYQGFVNWVGIVEDRKFDFSNLYISDYWGIGHRFGIVPISQNKAYWAAGALALTITQNDANIYKTEMINIFKDDWPEMITDIISSTATNLINKIYVHDHNPIDVWYKNNVVLLGDSAHAPLPTSGQGACQALEDAWHLSQCLKNSPNDLSNAFKQFTDVRFNKTSNIIMSGRQLAKSIFNDDPLYCQQRNLASQQLDYDDMARGMAKGWSKGLPMNVSL